MSSRFLHRPAGFVVNRVRVCARSLLHHRRPGLIVTVVLASLLSHAASGSAAGWSVIGSQIYPVTVPEYRNYPASAWCGSHGLLMMGGEDGVALQDCWQYTAGERPSWNNITTASSPGRRMYASGIYDSARDRFIVFGGRWSGIAWNDVWALGLGGAAHWDSIPAAGTPPSKRYFSAAIYDPLRDRLLVFGGRGLTIAQRSNEVWALSLSDPPTWTLVATAGTPPTPRYGAAGLYDAARDRMIVHGGNTAAGNVGETWALDLAADPPAWTLLDSAGTAVETAIAIADPSRDRMVVWGGTARAFDLATATWSTITVATPLSQSNTAAVYDPSEDAMIAATGDGATADVWTLFFADPPRWIRYSRGKGLSNSTVATGGSATYDATRDRLAIWDRDIVDNVNLRTLTLSGVVTWTLQSVSGHPSGDARDGHRVVWDTRRDRMLLFGGRSHAAGTPVYNDVWTLAGDPPFAWSAIVPSAPLPPARHHGAVVYDPVRDRLIVAGGLAADGNGLSDAWELLLTGAPQWHALVASGAAPALGECNAVYDAAHDRMIVVTRSGVWAMSMDAAPVWTPLSAAVPPGLSLALDASHNRLLTVDGSYWGARLYSYDLIAGGTWQIASPYPPASAGICRDCSLVYDSARDRAAVLGLEGFPQEGSDWYPDPDAYAYDFGGSPVCGTGVEIASFTPGTDTWWPQPQDALGTSDDIPLTLGAGGSVMLRLDHPATDGLGVDLYVHEIGSEADARDVNESCLVEASSDGATFVPLGTSPGSMRGFDLAGSGVSVARYLRITDLPPSEAGVAAGMAGADIDAVEVVHCSETADVTAVPAPPGRSAIALVRPNPGAGTQAFELRLAAPGAASLAVYSADGRRVWSRSLAGLGPGAHVILWDGRDAAGRTAPPAVYFARLESAAGASTRRFVRIR